MGNQGGGNPFGHLGAGTDGPHDRQEAEDVGQDGHEFRAQAHHGAFHDRVFQVLGGVQQTPGLPVIIGDVEIEEHNDAGFGIQSRRSDGPTMTPTLRS